MTCPKGCDSLGREENDLLAFGISAENINDINIIAVDSRKSGSDTAITVIHSYGSEGSYFSRS